MQHEVTEVWRPVLGFEGLYEVSSLGAVRKHQGPLLKPSIARCGYLLVNLRRGKVGKSFYVHRLVLTAFVGTCPDGKEACHDDGNRLSNVVSNLRWDTRRNNIHDKARHGTQPRGSTSASAILNEQKVVEIKKLLQDGGLTQRQIGSRYGVSRSCILGINRGAIWKHV